jgi:transcriptional regulator with XRE-family HTH domain
VSRNPNGDADANLDDNAVMTSVGQLLAKARASKEWSLQGVAERLGVSRSAVNQWELGITQPENDRVPEVLSLLNIDANAYMQAVEQDSRNPSPNTQRKVDAERSQKARSLREADLRELPHRGRLRGDASAFAPFRGAPDDLPVYGAQETGGGAMKLTQTAVEEVQPVPYSADAFDVYVASDSMSPAYERGDRIRIFPNRPVTPGRDVLFLSSALQDGADAVIRRLVEITPTHWICKQWNPPREARLDRKEWPIAYRIVSVTRQ